MAGISTEVTNKLPYQLIEILEYNDERGRSPFRRWFNRLNHQAAARVAVALERMSEGNLGDVKSVGNGVMERRITFGPGYRIYSGFDGDRLVILLGGGDKRRQRADIRDAYDRWKRYRDAKH